MTIQVDPKNADALAVALREETASPEDLLRIERGLARELRARTAPSRSRGLLPLGVALGVLAAVALFWFARPADEVVARVALHTPDAPPGDVPVHAPGDLPLHAPGDFVAIEAARVGQRIEGPAPVETQLGNALLAVGASSSLRVDEIDITRAAVTLTRGRVRIAFHPEHRGEEHLAVLTAAARVDIVGTELVVSISEGGGTRVEVIEGVVRVTPTSGAEATLVTAGGAIEVANEGASTGESESESEGESAVRAHAPTSAEAVVVDPALEERTRLEGEAFDHARRGEWAAVVEIDSRILALDPRGEHGANALWDRAETREVRLGDPGRARADYERYLTAYPTGSFAASAQQRIERLSAFPSTP